ELIGIRNKWVDEENRNNPDSAKETEMAEASDSDAGLFSLTGIAEFTGNDEAMLREVVRSFIDTHKINLTALHSFYEAKDLKGMQNTAHKMLPSYAYLHIHTLVPKLRFLESVSDIHNEEIEKVLLEILEKSRTIINLLEKYYQQHRHAAV
ncbi:MAG: hypothetical protein ACK4IY_02075, partial [Chitinophagales bacterium]